MNSRIFMNQQAAVHVSTDIHMQQHEVHHGSSSPVSAHSTRTARSISGKPTTAEASTAPFQSKASCRPKSQPHTPPPTRNRSARPHPETTMSTLAENLITAVKSVAALAGAGCVALLGALYAFQRKLIFAGHAMDIGPALPIRKGRKIEVDVRNEQRPRGAPDVIVGVYFPPTKPNAKTLAFWHGNADQIGNVGDHLGHVLQRNQGWGFFAVEYPGYALCAGGEPTPQQCHLLLVRRRP